MKVMVCKVQKSKGQREARKAEQNHKGQLWKAIQRKLSLRRVLKVESEALESQGRKVIQS